MKPSRDTAQPFWPTRYGIAAAVTMSKLARIAPISREMVLNFVAQTSLGLPRSY